MKKLLFIIPAIALGGCQSLGSLTPAQDASLTCLATQAGAALAATHANALQSAQIQADGSTLCTFATGASVVVTK